MQNKDFTLILLAGGKGTRMDLLSRITPKPLMCAFDEPLLIRQVRQAQEAGIKNILVSTNPMDFNFVVKVLKEEDLLNVRVLSNPHHEKGSLPALRFAMDGVTTEKVVMSFSDIFFWKDPFENLLNLVKEYNYLLGVSKPFSKKELSLGGIMFIRNKKVQKIVENPVKNNKVGLRWNGLAYFDKSQGKLLEQFLSRFDDSSPEGNFFDLLHKENKIDFYACLCPDFINVNRPDNLLCASLYRYSEVKNNIQIKKIGDQLRKIHLSKI